VLMLMPFQVTMVSSYLVLDSLRLMDTLWAIILPGAASTFPVFIMTRFFAAIPASLTEAAALDGAGPFQVFLRVGLPLGAPGILSAVVLGFFEYWNALEVPLTFLKDKSLWPLSLYLPAISSENLGVSLIASVVMLTPALLIFLFGQKYLEQGITAAGMKEGVSRSDVPRAIEGDYSRKTEWRHKNAKLHRHQRKGHRPMGRGRLGVGHAHFA